MSSFFIRRPIFAIMIALLIMLAGGLSILRLPVERLPPIAPPSIQVNATVVELRQVRVARRQASEQAPYLYALSIVVVFLSLAALYESWSIPVSVIMGALTHCWRERTWKSSSPSPSCCWS